jgi:hypothetical protein
MADLRTEIKDAFDKEQGAFLPPAAMRHEVIEAVLSERQGHRTDIERQPNLQWVGVAAAILITVAIVAGLMSVRLAQRQSPARPSPATSTPAPLVDYGPPPAGVQLIYMVDPRNYSWLQAYDWQGHPRGTVKLAQPANPGHVPAVQQPDGSGFVVAYDPKGGTATYLDRLGQPIAEDPQPLCAMTVDQQTFVWTLTEKLPGHPVRQVAVIAHDQGIGQTGISLVACSVPNDIAILVRTTISYPSELWAVRLSNGTLVSHHTYAANALARVVASPDGVYIAENSMIFTNSPNPQGALLNQIRRVSDWSVLATLGAPGPAVLSFSGDDSLVLTANLPINAGQPSHLGLLDWRSGSELWHYDGPEQFDRFLAQPNGRDFALGLMTPTRHEPSPCGQTPQTACRAVEDPLRDVIIVHGSGSTAPITGRYLTLW